MSLFESLAGFFGNLFGGNSPEAKLKRELRNIEIELKTSVGLLKEGMVQPLFAQRVFSLYMASIYIREVLSLTLFSGTFSKKMLCVELCLKSVFTDGFKEELHKLSYENKKEAAIKDSDALESQRITFEKLLQDISSNSKVKQAQSLLYTIEQLYDLCSLDFVAVLKLFNENFSESTLEAPEFNEVPIEQVEGFINDYLYVATNLNITKTVASAIIAFAEIQYKNSFSPDVSNEILGRLKKIFAVSSRSLNPTMVLNMIRVTKKDMQFKSAVAKYDTTFVSMYCGWMRSIFDAEKTQIELDIQREQVKGDLQVLFPDNELMEIQGYNNSINVMLTENNLPPLVWMLPMQIVKTFLTVYFPYSLEALFEAVVVEGFFEDQIYQSSFASVLYNCKELKDMLNEFENGSEGKPSPGFASIAALVESSKLNVEDAKRLDLLLANKNDSAKKIMDEATHSLLALARVGSELLGDFKRSKSELVSNLKVLFLAARNKEAVETFDKQFSQWLKFFDVMTHYVVIKKAEYPT